LVRFLPFLTANPKTGGANRVASEKNEKGNCF